MKQLIFKPETFLTKKLLLSFIMLLLCTFKLFSQVDDEKRLNIKPLDLKLQAVIPNGNIDCHCTKNILQDGGFQHLTVNPGSSNISSSSTPWKPNTGTPQWTPLPGACENGYVSMWGNKTVGESIAQTGLSIVAGKKYQVKFTARFLNPTSLCTFVNLKISAFNGAIPAPYGGTSVFGISTNISSLAWATYTIPCWTAPINFTGIQLHPENQYSLNNGAYVSWIQIDNICIEECVDTCKCINFPKPPPINGPKVICACDPVRFSTLDCNGAHCNWTVKDNLGNIISFTGNGNPAINLNYSLAQQIASGATSLTVTVTITCGNQTVTNTITVPLKPIPPTNINFTLTNSGGVYSVTASAIGLATSLGNGWTLKEFSSCPSPCTWKAGPIKWMSTGNSITITSPPLVKGKCYILTHYVNVCSPTWIAGPCTVYKATCFYLDGNNLKMRPLESDKNDAQMITEEMSEEIIRTKSLPNIQNN